MTISHMWLVAIVLDITVQVRIGKMESKIGQNDLT